MPRVIRTVGRVLAATLVVAATVPAEAGTTRSVKVSGVTRGATVGVEATVQCPQGQNECSSPQGASAVVKLAWPGSSAEFEIQQLEIKSPRDPGGRWELRGSIKIEGDLPEGKTAGGDLALTTNEDYAIEKMEVTVRK